MEAQPCSPSSPPGFCSITCALRTVSYGKTCPMQLLTLVSVHGISALNFLGFLFSLLLNKSNEPMSVSDGLPVWGLAHYKVGKSRSSCSQPPFLYLRSRHSFCPCDLNAECLMANDYEANTLKWARIAKYFSIFHKRNYQSSFCNTQMLWDAIQGVFFFTI